MSVAGSVMGLSRVAGAAHRDAARWVVLAFVCALAATLWAFTRLPMAGSLHGWSSQLCVRLEMDPRDWPCQITLSRTLVVYLAASALVSLATLVPAAVLALRGRRLLAFVPMIAPLGITILAHASSWAWSGHWVALERTTTPQLFLGPWEPWTSRNDIASVWRPDHPFAIGADLLLLAVPVVAAIVLLRPPKAERVGFSARAILLACALAAGASAIVEIAAHAVTGADPYLVGGWFLQGLVIVSFGLLLPLGPGRPLWTIAPVACLLSLGAPAAIVGSLSGFTTFAFFRSAVPLALMGLAGAGASAFVARQRGLDRAPPPRRAVHIRPASIAHGLGMGALAVATVMFALDPFPFEVSTALPTYLGARERVTDLRARLSLDEAMGVAIDHREAHGSFAGFDAAAARDSDPHLLWAQGVPDEDMTLGPELTVHVTSPTTDRIELVLVGPGTAYCLRSADGKLTYGVGSEGRPRERALDAVGSCGDAPWTAELLRPFPIEGLCEDAPDIVLCRMVQQRLLQTLASPTGIA